MRPIYLLLGLSFIALLSAGCSSSEQPVPSAPTPDLEATVEAMVQKELEKTVSTPIPIALTECKSLSECHASGFDYLESGEYSRALPYFTDAIALDPRDAVAYYNRGLAYHELGQYEKAIENYSETIRLDPQVADAYYNRGRSYSQLGQYERVLEDLNEALRINPLDADFYYHRSLAYIVLDLYERALEDLNKALRINPLHEKTVELRRELLEYIKN